MPPAVGCDQVLGERQHAHRAHAGGRPRHGQRHAQAMRGKPAAEQRGAEHARQRRAGEAHDDAEREIEMPDLGGERGRQRRQRRGRHADDGEHAQAETIDDPARDRCRDAADQEREAVDQRDRTAARIERALQGGHEDDEAVADRAARHAQREAQRHQRPGHEPAHRLHPCIAGEPSARSAARRSFDGRHAHHRAAFQRPATVGQRRLCRRRDGRQVHAERSAATARSRSPCAHRFRSTAACRSCATVMRCCCATATR